ncbi:MAG: hypothetical protein ACE5PV_17775 [Candidatus Poribacteria bacterium]
MSIEFLAKVNEDGTIYLPEKYRYLQSRLVKVQLSEQRKEELRHRRVVDNIVPVKLLERYHELSDRRLRGEMTAFEVSELQQVEQEIEKIEESHPILGLLDQQEEHRHKKMMESLEDISNKLKTLIESL